MLIAPADELRPDSVPCGPRSTSIRSTSPRSFSPDPVRLRYTPSMNTATELSSPGLSPTVPMPRSRAVALASDPVDDTISDGASCAIWRMSVAPEFCSAAVL